MSAGFLSRLARRALANQEIHPRVASRFENPASAMEPRVDTATPHGAAPEIRAATPVYSIALADPSATPPVAHEITVEHRHTLTRQEIVERVTRLDARVESSTPAPTPAPAIAVPPALTATANSSAAPAPLLAQRDIRTRTEAAIPAQPPVLIAAPSPIAPVVAQGRASGAVTPRIESAPAMLTPPASTTSPPAMAPVPTTPASPASIEIVIGRIEIRGFESSPSPVRTMPGTPHPTSMSLDDYLRSRDGRSQEGRTR